MVIARHIFSLTSTPRQEYHQIKGEPQRDHDGSRYSRNRHRAARAGANDDVDGFIFRAGGGGGRWRR
jgi:hypothetical protein